MRLIIKHSRSLITVNDLITPWNTMCQAWMLDECWLISIGPTPQISNKKLHINAKVKL